MSIKKNVILLGLILLMAFSLTARDKQEKIGDYSWYTEQNTLEEIIQAAKKAGKPILAVFSATWCGPCQHVKKTVFKTAEFKKVAQEAVLLYIEETTKEGKAYNKKYKIRGWPTFKIFSKEGIMLDTGNPKRTVDGFVDWIKDVKGGRAAQFTAANTEYLSNTSSDFNFGDTDWSMFGWFYLDTAVGPQMIISKQGGASDRNYSIDVDTNENLRVVVSEDGSTPIAIIDTSVTFVATTWYFFSVVHDSV